jgi:hypothetical protein
MVLFKKEGYEPSTQTFIRYYISSAKLNAKELPIRLENIGPLK